MSSLLIQFLQKYSKVHTNPDVQPTHTASPEILRGAYQSRPDPDVQPTHTASPEILGGADQSCMDGTEMAWEARATPAMKLLLMNPI